MKILKFSLLLGFLSLFVMSCSDDCDVLSETAVGTWNFDLNNGGSVTLNSDGSLVDTDNVLFDVVPSTAARTWSVSGNSLTLQANDNGALTFWEFDITTFDCDSMVGPVNGSSNDITFTRS